MEFARAKQILDAEETIEVMFDGSPVWIESLNSGSHTAMVKPLTGPNSILEVPVTQLVEG